MDGQKTWQFFNRSGLNRKFRSKSQATILSEKLREIKHLKEIKTFEENIT